MKPRIKVVVRPGARMMQDGQRPRVGKPDKDGREWPGRYLFHDVENPGPDFDADGNEIGEPTSFVFVDREEETFDCPAIRQSIVDGLVEVVDKKHELHRLNVAKPNTPKKSKSKDQD
jgi:hypothetical protein